MFINRTFYHTPFHMRKTSALPEVHGILHPQGFIDHAERLQTLQNNVAVEAQGATAPQAQMEYMQLIQVLADLVNDAQGFSGLPYQIVMMREASVLAFVEKVAAVQTLVSDWEARREAEKAAALAAPVSRKRGREEEEDEELEDASFAMKKNRNLGINMVQQMDFDASFCGPFAEFPQIEQQAAPQLVWWNAPFSN